MASDEMLINELAKRAGVTVRTIRYYMDQGLLPPPNQKGRYAIYSNEHLERLELIRRLKAIRLPLDEIRQLLNTVSAEELAQLLESQQNQGDTAAPINIFPSRNRFAQFVHHFDAMPARDWQPDELARLAPQSEPDQPAADKQAASEPAAEQPAPSQPEEGASEALFKLSPADWAASPKSKHYAAAHGASSRGEGTKPEAGRVEARPDLPASGIDEPGRSALEYIARISGSQKVLRESSELRRPSPPGTGESNLPSFQPFQNQEIWQRYTLTQGVELHLLESGRDPERDQKVQMLIQAAKRIFGES